MGLPLSFSTLIIGKIPRPLYQYLRGKALNVLPSFSKEAEVLLSQAVKQNPLLVDAWNALGESYWKTGNVSQAHHCFTGALNHVRGALSLSLSSSLPSSLLPSLPPFLSPSLPPSLFIVLAFYFLIGTK